MRTLITAAVTVLALSGPTSAQQLEELAAQSIDAYEQIETIKKEMRNATGPLSDEARSLDQAVWTFENPPMSPTELESLDKQIAEAKSWLTQLQQQSSSADAIRRARTSLEQLQLQRTIGTMTDDSQRSSFRAELEKKRASIKEQIDELEEPYRDRIGAVAAVADEHSQTLTNAMKPFFATPGGAYGETSVQHVNFTMNMAFGGLQWSDAEGNQVAWAHVRLRPESEITDQDRRTLLDGTYPIRAHGNDSIWVWAGNFLVTFVASTDALKNKDVLQTAVGEFVDLESLASVNVPESGSAMAGVEGAH